MSLQTWLPFLTPSAIQSKENDPTLISWNAGIDSWNTQTPVVIEDGQLVVLLLNQKMVAIVEKGTYPLDWIIDEEKLRTQPALRAYFFSTKTFSDQRWGTPSPILVNDTSIGMSSLRAHGAFSYKLSNPKRLWQHLPNEFTRFTVDDLSGQLRALILEHFSALVSKNQNNILQFLSECEAFSAAIKNELHADFQDYGLELVDFIVQSISAPQGQANSMEAMVKIEKLNDMLKKGLITQAEFDAKKQQLLKDI